jgi:hypothetical protein
MLSIVSTVYAVAVCQYCASMINQSIVLLMSLICGHSKETLIHFFFVGFEVGFQSHKVCHTCMGKEAIGRGEKVGECKFIGCHVKRGVSDIKGGIE